MWQGLTAAGISRSAVSNVKLKSPLEGRLVALRPRRDSSDFIAWRMAHARHPECCRWECVDGRWVSLTLCHEEDMGKVLVRDSAGRAELTESYEGGLALARRWRNEQA
jgi:hypothetical protein